MNINLTFNIFLGTYIIISSLYSSIHLLYQALRSSTFSPIIWFGVIFFLAVAWSGSFLFKKEDDKLSLLIILQIVQVVRTYIMGYTIVLCSGPIMMVFYYTNLLKGFEFRIEPVDYTILFSKTNPVYGFGINIIPLIMAIYFIIIFFCRKR